MPKIINRFAVYWFDPNPGRGSELKKVRPCVVISPNEMNSLLKTVLVIPLTSTVKPWPFRVKVKIAGQASSAACDQLRAIDKSRLREHLTDLSAAESDNILAVLQVMLSK